MKKIVSAAVAATLLASAAFADASIKAEGKYKGNVAQFNSGKESANTYAEQTSYVDGIVIDLKDGPVDVYGKFEVKDSGIGASSVTGKVTIGNLNLTVGKNDSRFTNRVANDQNDLSFIEQNWGYKLWAYDDDTSTATKPAHDWKLQTLWGNKKLGVNANLGLTAGVDSDNVMAVNGSKALSFIADYTIANVLPGKLLLKAAAKSKDTWASQELKDWDEDGIDEIESSSQNKSAYSFEAAFTHELFTADAVFNLDNDNLGSFAFFLRPLAVENLNSVLGFTYAWDKSGASKTGGTKQDSTFWAVDLRARYAINEQLAAGIYTNLTGYTVKKGDVTSFDGLMALDVVLNVNYKINDIAKVFVEGEYATKALSAQKADTAKGQEAVGAKYGDAAAAAQLGVILTPAKGATITTAVCGTFAGVGAGKEDDINYSDYTGTSITIPVVFKVSL